MVFFSLYLFLDKSNILVVEVIKVGIFEFDFKYFLVVIIYDRYGNMILIWLFNDKFWMVVYDKCFIDIIENRFVIILDLVRGELEKWGLIYLSKIKKILKIFFWLIMCFWRF